MKQQDFEQSYQEQWQRLERLLNGDTQTSSEANAEFPELYRHVCHHLALAKHRRYSPHLIDRLHRLVMDGHHQLYRHSARFRYQLVRFILLEFPLAIRRNSPYVFAAALLFVLPIVLMGVGCYLNEELVYSVSSPQQVRMMESMYDPGNEHLGRESDSASDLAMFGFYIKNNIGIAFRTFASGILFGLGTIFFLLFNGVMIGSIGGHLTQVGYVDTFYPFVIGHGAFELTAIVFSGAAGLKLGFAMVDPGPYSRLTALRIAGRESIAIVYGAGLMLLIAAFLEAFWSSSQELSRTVKYSVGALLWLLVLVYCGWGGRSRRGSQSH